jgi:hypothetical protein
MDFTSIALSLILVAILILIPCGCILTRQPKKEPPNLAPH